MDLIKAKTILSRLQAMHQSLEQNDHLSTLERDLILNYLRELYEIYSTAETTAIPRPKQPTSSDAEKNAVEKEGVQKTLEFKFETEQKTETEKPADQPVNIYEPLLKSETFKIEPLPSSPILEKEVIEEAIADSKTTPNISILKSSNIPVSITELFEIKKGTELSDKLNELPLKDINRGIGLNDKLEIINTLFGNQKTLFEVTINELNSLKSFDDAHHLLGTGPAIQFKWDHEDRKEKAIEFIKLIRRRYL